MTDDTNDLMDQQEAEQFTEETDDKPSKEVARYLREQRRFEKLNLKKTQVKKHKATFARIDNINQYICDDCGKPFKKEGGNLIYTKDGEFGYCVDCLKKRYPNYTPIHLAGTVDKLDYMSNHADTQYFNRL